MITKKCLHVSTLSTMQRRREVDCVTLGVISLIGHSCLGPLLLDFTMNQKAGGERREKQIYHAQMIC